MIRINDCQPTHISVFQNMGTSVNHSTKMTPHIDTLEAMEVTLVILCFISKRSTVMTVLKFSFLKAMTDRGCSYSIPGTAHSIDFEIRQLMVNIKNYSLTKIVLRSNVIFK